ncbi:MAG: aminotransferase class III-fold pyridoxal phosphate-dependent enzyme [Actinomycetota bacterium]|nr:aminotransferase class III-fold pyridoxal phosphate-dependent enzyme [Actinomycetota bacterium]MEC9424685.1 aminotransferase class III-fold pyridoxal phosphate-dependent enzyme [Actinomycetota bacterium]MEC9467033.1 aminotransferase class III-fold pyridoxal phosphate-dependent enzyme [Actinomycetota bacterium]MED6328448.1 aminotransferase class III-fold pyridoxal phosphate-dependent enzyme [Actinomycetota bacterium]
MSDMRHLAQQHLIPHFTKKAAWHTDGLPIIERGEGCYLYDTEGNEYLDGLAGLFCVNIGHGRSDLSAVAAKQMDTLAFATNWGFAHPPAIEAAALISGFAPGDLSETFFVSSGSEAVESAVKFARNYHVARGEEGRYKVISRNWAYHGTTLGALSVTGIPKLRAPYLPALWDGARHVPNTRQCSSPEGTPAADLSCVQAVEEMILMEGPETVSMVIAEPIQNGGGALVPPDGYWQELRRICDRYGVLLVADEVICSFGRFGHWFASERNGVIPDMITFAKGVTSAYQPLGGVVIRGPLVEELYDSPMGSYVHGSTFGGHPVATAVAVANMTAMRDEGLLGHVLDTEDSFAAKLQAMGGAHSSVREVRGTGFFYAVDLCADSTAGRDLSPSQETALQGGVLGGFVREEKMTVRPDDRGYTGLTISPPLVADGTVIDDLVARVDRVVDRVDAWLAEND